MPLSGSRSALLPGEDDLAVLDRISRARLSLPLPSDFAEFLRHSNGMRVSQVDAEHELNDSRQDDFEDHALMSSSGIVRWLQSHSYNETSPDRSTIEKGPRLLPFYDLAETGCHAFDPSGKVVDVDNTLIVMSNHYAGGPRCKQDLGPV